METVASTTNPPAIDRVRDLLVNVATAIWRVLANQILLLALSVAALGLILIGLFVPQMPDQFNADPAAAARWKLGVVAAYGMLAGPLEAFGVFNLLQSTLLRILLVLIALMLFVQLGAFLGIALTVRRLPRALRAPPVRAGTPLFLSYSGPLYRDRSVVDKRLDESSDETADTLTGNIADVLASRFGDVRRHALTIEPDGEVGPGLDSAAPERSDTAAVVHEAAGGTSDRENQVEERFLAMSHRRLLYLRSLLPLGLLLALAGLWINAVFGWEIISPNLSPAESFQHPPQRLELFYPPIIDDGGAAPAIQIELGDAQKMIAVGDDAQVGGKHVISRQTIPALLVEAEPVGVRLSRLGESVRIEASAADEPMVLGLAFPESGREEVLALPDQAMGVRIVRLPNNTYSIELYEAGGTEPIERFSLDTDRSLPVPLSDTGVTLTFYPTIGTVTAVRFAPGRWLFWPALLAFGLGLIGFVRQPSFLLTQIAPWSPAKYVIITQSNSREMLAELVAVPQQAEDDE